ncbi:hypothetical protein C2845_PM07G10820 [Panicum miliaceum]|uniref:Uncharacterized protein n=1 Tax=Panicum miliaceum TaxID=4540 RepID=A0A3L6SL47_PANMI|nr:hypothetical protein C2845_PM07G10820 [Panicum miliaceum]
MVAMKASEKPSKVVAEMPFFMAQECISSCTLDQLESTTYWLAQIRLAESDGKHWVAAEFFRLAFECQPAEDSGRLPLLSCAGGSKKLEVVEERSDQIIKEYSKFQDTLSSIGIQTDHLAETSKNVGEQMNYVLAHLKAVFEKSKEIAAAQVALKEGLTKMREKIDARMARVEESYESLDNGMDKLKEETGETIQKLAQFGQREQEELLARQEQIQQTHDLLIQNSHSILEAHEEANIFAALDKLYILHNAILGESRFSKAFFFCCRIVFLIYMLHLKDTYGWL